MSTRNDSALVFIVRYAAFSHFHFMPPMRLQGCGLLLPAHVLLQPRLQQLLHNLRTRNYQGR